MKRIPIRARAIHCGIYSEFTIFVEGNGPISESEALARVKQRLKEPDAPRFNFLVQDIEIVEVGEAVTEPIVRHGIHPTYGLVRS